MDRATRYALLMAFFWALNIFFGKLALNAGYDPFALSAQTAVVAAVAYYAVNIAIERREAGKILQRWKALAAIGVAYAFAGVSGGLGLLYSTSINYGFLIKTTLIFTPLLCALWLREKITRTDWTIIAALLAGSYLVSTGGVLLVPRLGDLLIVAAALGYSAATVPQKMLGEKYDVVLTCFYRLAVSAPLLFAFAAATGRDALAVPAPLPMLLCAVSLYLCNLYITKTLSVASPAYMTMINNVTPVIVAALGIAFLSETMNAVQVAGAAIILAGGFVNYSGLKAGASAATSRPSALTLRRRHSSSV